jgi:hypothetical protein
VVPHPDEETLVALTVMARYMPLRQWTFVNDSTGNRPFRLLAINKPADWESCFLWKNFSNYGAILKHTFRECIAHYFTLPAQPELPKAPQTPASQDAAE